MSLNTYRIVTDNNLVFTTTETEYVFDEAFHYLGDSNLYVITDTNSYRPYIPSGANWVYVPGSGVGYNAYRSIRSVELLDKRGVDFFPALAICLLGVLCWRTLRSIFSRRVI